MRGETKASRCDLGDYTDYNIIEKGKQNVFVLNATQAIFRIEINNKNKINLPFFDVVFTKSSLTDDALHELGLSEEYSLIGVVDWGDIRPVES